MNDEQKSPPPTPQYRWPRYVLAAVILAIVLAILWLGPLIRRTREQRQSNPWAPLPSATDSNPPPARP